MNRLHKFLSTIAVASALTLGGWLLPACAKKGGSSGLDGQTEKGGQIGGEIIIDPDISPNEGQNGASEATSPTPAVPEKQPEVQRAEYIKITAGGVNIRSGAGTEYARLGVAEKDTLYPVTGRVGSWYKTVYRHSAAYIHADYCKTVNMDRCANDELEEVIGKGYECLGVPYVYGAVRYHDGKGNRLGGFTDNAFDCSSLMQYMFKLGAGVNLQVNTRTQIYQGVTVSAGNLRRGDLMFFTNASRKNLTGIERVGHVAIYLGDNYILHTASDYAKIEQISSTRWSYYIQAQRII